MAIYPYQYSHLENNNFWTTLMPQTSGEGENSFDVERKTVGDKISSVSLYVNVSLYKVYMTVIILYSMWPY